MICWVRSAILAARSVGSPSASSKPLVCRLWVPPSAAARACTVTRTMLFSGCWAVSVEPPVWVWKRSIGRPLVAGPEALGHDPGPHPPCRPVLGDLLEEVVVGVPEERQPGSEVVHLEPGRQRRLDVGDAVGEREGDLLDGGRPRLPDVVARDRDRVPVGQLLRAVAKGVDDEPHRRTRAGRCTSPEPRTPSRCRSGSCRRAQCPGRPAPRPPAGRAAAGSPPWR